MNGLRVALVHDDLTQRGGAERVALSLHRLFPDAPIYTSVFEPAATYPEFSQCDVRTTWLQRLPGGARHPRVLLPLYPAAFEGLVLSGYDLVVSSSSRFAHGVQVEGGFHVTYCHTPPRFLYDAGMYLGTGGPVPRPLAVGLQPVFAAMRRWDRRAARRPDAYVANSRETAGRIRRHYGREALVVHPPVDLTRFTRPSPPPPTDPYLLAVSRLLPYKRVDLAVQAATVTGRRLVVVGSGPALSMLRRLAGPTVEFREHVPDDELASLLAGCAALVQAGVEDFGLAPIEANAAGRPAVAFAAAGALESVVDGETGVLFHEPSVAALVDAIERAEATGWDADALRAHARSMGEERFHQRLLAALSELGFNDLATPPAPPPPGPARRDWSGARVWRR